MMIPKPNEEFFQLQIDFFICDHPRKPIEACNMKK